jgi:hypothetical protein
MTKRKDTIAINNSIIELAKANDWLSRDNLKERTGKPIKTIKEYLQKDLFNFIDTKDFTELVNRNTGRGKTNIEKYKLKSAPENLLAIFDYLETKQYQKRIMQTDYYKNFIPYIDKTARELFLFKDSDNEYYDHPDSKILTDITFKLSPSAVNFILRGNVDKKNEELFRILLAEEPPSKLLLMIFSTLLMADVYEKIIDEKELFKFRTLEQLSNIPFL